MVEAHIDGLGIRTVGDFYEAFAQIEGVPQWFGRNLDALWDTVTGLLDGPVTLNWFNADASAEAMGDDFETLVSLLRNAERETATKFTLHLMGAAN